MSEYKVIYSKSDLLIYVDLNEKGQRSLFVKEPLTGLGFNSRFPHGLTIYHGKTRNKLIFQFTGPNSKRVLCTLNMGIVKNSRCVLTTFKRYLKEVYDRTTQLYDLSMAQNYGGILYKEGLPFVYKVGISDRVYFYNPFTKKSETLAFVDDPKLLQKQKAKSKEIIKQLSEYRVSHKNILGSINVIKGRRGRPSLIKPESTD